MRMEFVGVTTGASSINRLFPLWAQELGLDGARLVGRDLPLRAPREAYRAAVEEIRDDPQTLGALVTTHKLAVLESARDLFDELNDYAEQLGEVSSISKRDGRLRGHALDPITAGCALEHIGPFDGDVLCLGAGGAGTAIVLHLLQHRKRIAVTDTDPARLEEVAALGDVEIHPAQAGRELLEALPPGSLVINATGLGKDRPGSPLPAGSRFPDEAVVWELNYRGELEFLHQARAQEGLRVHDGWLYFLYGWATVIAEVFDLEITPERFERLRETAGSIR
jgi:shikimate dehydrogenase